MLNSSAGNTAELEMRGSAGLELEIRGTVPDISAGKQNYGGDMIHRATAVDIEGIRATVADLGRFLS